MGKKGGDTRVKRQMAPTFWAIKRKQSQFVLRVKPGPHPKHRAYPSEWCSATCSRWQARCTKQKEF